MNFTLANLLTAICLVIPIWIAFRLVSSSNRKEAVRVATEHRMRIITVHTYGYQYALDDFNYLMKLVNQYDIKPEEIGAISYKEIARVTSNSFKRHLEFITETKQELYSKEKLWRLKFDLATLQVLWEL